MYDAEKLKQEFNEFHLIRMQHAHMIAKRNGGISWPFGWNQIVRHIFELCSGANYNIAAVQVKEKFGGLRFYYDVIGARNEVIDRMISELEGMSDSMCDICGAPGTKCGKHWIVTRCEEHLEDKRPDFCECGLREMYIAADAEFYKKLQLVGVSRV